ncbi:M16 family metallopeptidase [Tenacibaculum finnmarkense]|uniref:M16 family metallopeptidase n=1 Tax=Tenacibaculum finnmarkense TaxID=2781243 RepID=UPI001EFBA3FD|nr:pitrilysin family protein [Tenacibaculum finnmarkense]MCG8802558.1 insulinase family protein [Tenacibaculum finnmarkense]MCG8825286.1 insulinase family protein [Tenacibaculum finnmarkense]
MKTKIVSLIAILAMSFATTAQIDRSVQPKPGPAPKVRLGKVKKFTLPNGLQVIMVENHKLPRASASLTIDNKAVFEGEKAGLSSVMGSLLGRGTANITKDEFNEKVDYLGAYVDFYSSGASASSLIKYFPEVLGLMADGVKNSAFTKEEFDKEITVTLNGLKSNEKSVTAIARRVESALIYGKKHPFGEFTTKKSIGNITLADVKNNFNTYYKPNNAYLVIVGDINTSKTKKMVTKLFSNWKKGNVPAVAFDKPKNVNKTEINFINMPNAVQSEIVVANNIDLKLGDKDYYAAILANTILGGGGTARLFLNLREDKGYTYGSYSSIRQSRDAATFRASASVRNIVTDSSVVEIQKEIRKIRTQKVSDEELKNAKAKYVGNFVMEVQKPVTAARYALNIARYNLPTDFYENYLENINSVTITDIQNAAVNYFKANNARIIITGKATDVLENLEKNKEYSIQYFDKEGNATAKPAMSLPVPKGVTSTSVIDNYFKAIGGKDKIASVKTLKTTSEAKVQGMQLTLVQKSAAPNKTSTIVSMAGNVMQKEVFDGTNGYQEARGQKKQLKGKELEDAKNNAAPFADSAYKNGTLSRIEPINGKNAYVIMFGKKEIFYDVKSGLKVKEVSVAKGPQGEVKVPLEFSDYKEVNGIKFPHLVIQSMGPMKMNFKLKEVKINEGVSNADFQ